MITRHSGSLRDALCGTASASSASKIDLFPNASDCFYFMDSDRSGEPFPIIISPIDGDVDSLFASVATYYPEMSCISALAHILDHEGLEAYTKMARQSRSKRDSSLQLFSGAIIGEALNSSDQECSLDDLSYSDCLSSLSFALARCSFIFGPGSAVRTCAENWQRLGIVGSGYRRKATPVELISQVIFQQQYRSGNRARKASAPDIAATYVDLVSTDMSAAKSYVLREIEARAEILPDTIRAFRGAFDSRLSAYISAMKQLGEARDVSELDRSFLSAFLCNLIQPGSLAHIGLVRKSIEAFPDSLIWYSIIALNDEAAVPRSSLVLKIQRDITKEFLFTTPPTCDVSIAELEVLNRMPLKASMLKPYSNRNLIVSLYPGVEVPWKFEDPRGPLMRSAARAQNTTRATKLLREALDLLQREKGN